MKKTYFNDTKPTPSTKDLEPYMTIDREREAELTLLSLILTMNPVEIEEFLLEMDISPEEYQQLQEKYSRIINRYNEEKKS
jgi:hypothetical protein